MIRLSFLFLFLTQFSWAQTLNFEVPLHGITLETIYEFEAENGSVVNYGNPFNYKEIQFAQALYFFYSRETLELSLATAENFSMKERANMKVPGTVKSKYFPSSLNPNLFKRLILEQVDEGGFGVALFFQTFSGTILCFEGSAKSADKAAVLDAMKINLKGLNIEKPTTPKPSTNTKSLDVAGPIKNKVKSTLAPLSDIGQIYGNGPWMDINDKNELMIAWHSIRRGFVVTAFDLDSKKQTWEHELKGLDLSSFCALPDGYAVLTGKESKYLNEGVSYIYCQTYNRQHQKILDVQLTTKRETKEVGDQIYVETNRGCGSLAYGAGKLVAHYATQMLYSDGIAHQGSRVDIIDEKGNLEVYEDWSVSHSFQQLVKVDGNSAIYLNLGDAHPRGLQYDLLGLDSYIEEDEDYDDYESNSFMTIAGKAGDNEVADTRIGDFVVDGDNTFVCYDTEEDVKGRSSEYFFDQYYNDLFLAGVNREGEPLCKVNLTNTPNTDEAFGKIVNYGDDLLIVYSEMTYPTEEADELGWTDIKTIEKYMICTKAGKIKAGPYPIKTQFYNYAQQQEKIWANYAAPPATEGTQLLTAPNGKHYYARMLLNRPYVEIIEIEE
ncbi:MAG: hypothetical protein GY810_07090 [Aureispira sp.]|nr:hypothetical protein [Aureispira sp.]